MNEHARELKAVDELEKGCMSSSREAQSVAISWILACNLVLITVSTCTVLSRVEYKYLDWMQCNAMQFILI